MNSFSKRIRNHLSLLFFVQTAYSQLLVTLNNPPFSVVGGHVKPSYSGKSYRAFYDIPYAEPPIGDLRYKDPVPAKPWIGVKGNIGPLTVCSQETFPNTTIISGTEDCLVINVYTPSMTPGKKLPVLLWFHGGGFKSGSNFFVVGLVAGRYDPAYLMDEEIVVVSPNYRIGPLGFLTTKDNVIPTNLGLRDQRLAINWVKDNIDKFGGDPSDIVIAGESAGAVSVGYHLIATYKELPITGAILISGSALCPWASHTKSRKNAFELARKLDHTFKSNRSEDLLKLLQSATPEQILARTGFRQSQGAQSFNGALTLAWVPTLGKGDDFSLPQTDAVDNGKFKKVPMLIGFNDEEGVNPYISGNYLQKSTAWEKDPSNMLFENIRVPRTKRKEFGQKLKSFYTNTSFVTDARSVIKICSDFALAMPTIRFAESASKHAQVYMFRTSQTFQPHPLAAVSGIEGVGHGEDLYYYWFNPLVTTSPGFEPMRSRMVKMISNFVKHKKPIPDAATKELFDNIEWPVVKPGRIPYVPVSSKTLEVQYNPRNYKKIKQVVDSYLTKPVTVYI